MAKLLLPRRSRFGSRTQKGWRRDPGYESVSLWRSGLRKACHRQIIRRETRCSARFPSRTYSPFAIYPTDDLIYTSVLITIDFSPSAGETRPLYRWTGVASLSRTYVVSLFPLHSCADTASESPPHVHGQTGRAGDFWSNDDRRSRSS